jgi:hypothetical protein
VQGGGQGLDGVCSLFPFYLCQSSLTVLFKVIPRDVLEKAYGFAFLSVVKVGAQLSGVPPPKAQFSKGRFPGISSSWKWPGDC